MVSAAAISFAFLRSRSSIILNVLTTYVSGARLPRALDCSLLATAHMQDLGIYDNFDADFKDQGWNPEKRKVLFSGSNSFARTPDS
jgi:hypothetical protein